MKESTKLYTYDDCVNSNINNIHKIHKHPSTGNYDSSFYIWQSNSAYLKWIMHLKWNVGLQWSGKNVIHDWQKCQHMSSSDDLKSAYSLSKPCFLHTCAFSSIHVSFHLTTQNNITFHCCFHCWSWALCKNSSVVCLIDWPDSAVVNSSTCWFKGGTASLTTQHSEELSYKDTLRRG